MNTTKEIDIDELRDELREYNEEMSELPESDAKTLRALRLGIIKPEDVEVVDCSGYDEDEVDRDVDMYDY